MKYTRIIKEEMIIDDVRIPSGEYIVYQIFNQNDIDKAKKHVYRYFLPDKQNVFEVKTKNGENSEVVTEMWFLIHGEKKLPSVIRKVKGAVLKVATSPATKIVATTSVIVVAAINDANKNKKIEELEEKNRHLKLSQENSQREIKQIKDNQKKLASDALRNGSSEGGKTMRNLRKD